MRALCMVLALWTLISVGAEPPPKPEAPQPPPAVDLDQVAREVFLELQLKIPNLNDWQKQRILYQLEGIRRHLVDVPATSFFKYTLDGSLLTVYNASGKLIIQWNNHDKMEIRGNVIALLDSRKEFAAYLSDGTALVTKWTNVQSYWLMSEYIGLLDGSKRIFNAYSTRMAKQIIGDWKDTIKVVAKERYIALLDSNGIFQGYTAQGAEIVKVSNVQDIAPVDETTVLYRLRTGETKTFPIVQ